MLVIIAAGYESSVRSPTENIPGIWGHVGCIESKVVPPRVDGVKVGACHGNGKGFAEIGELHRKAEGEGHQATMGIIVHELGHLIFAFPDLYDTDKTTSGVGGFCVMGSGSWGRKATDMWAGQTPVLTSAWLKYKWNWVTAVEGEGTKSINASSNSNTMEGIVYRNSTPNSQQYFLIENRQPVGYDQGLQPVLNNNDSGGLAIWHIDEKKNNNDNDSHRMVELEAADGTPLGTESGELTDLWYDGNFTVFDDESTPNTRLYNGKPSGVSISNISSSASVMTADFTKKELIDLIVVCQDTIIENSSAECSATAGFSDRSTLDLTNSVSWKENSIYSSFSKNGVFETSSVTSDQVVEVTAVYTLGKIVKIGKAFVTIKNIDGIIVSSVTPLNAILNEKQTFTVTGQGLNSGMGFFIGECEGVTELSGGSNTSRQFSCTPSYSSGRKDGIVKDQPGGNELFRFTVDVAPEAMRVTSVSPTSATLNEKQTFTVTGQV